MATYSFYDEFVVEIRGESDVIDNLRDTYRYFETDEPRPPDLICEGTEREPTPDVVLGGDDDYYGRDDDQFVISKPWGERMVISPQWDRLRVSPDTIHHHVAYLIEFELRKRLAARGRVLVHASGVRFEGRTFAFPAWRHAGKTNTMLSLLRSGGDYLADDRLWVGSDGSVEGYPLPVNVIPSKQRSFDDEVTGGGTGGARSELSEFVFDRVDIERSFLDKAVYFLTKYYLAPDPETVLVPVEALVPGAEFAAGPSQLDAMVFLRATRQTAEAGIELGEISNETAVAELMNVSFYEWNGRLREYFGAFDILFPGEDRAGQLARLTAEERRVAARIVDRTPTYRARIPRSREWVESGLDRRVVDRIGRIRPAASIDSFD